MAAIIQITGWQTCSLGLLCTFLILDIHAMINWHLSKQGIPWPVSRDHIAGSSSLLIEVTWFLELTTDQLLVTIGSRTHIWLTCWKQGRIVRKAVNASPGLKVNRIITFSSVQIFFLLLCFMYTVTIEIQNRMPKNIQKTSLQSYKTQIKILPFRA